MSETKASKSVAPSARDVGPNEEFIEDIFGAVEYEFTEQFGQKWSPEVNKMFEAALETCKVVALALDSRSAVNGYEQYSRARRVIRLTNHTGSRKAR